MVFDTICTLPLPADLFAQILHPTAPLLTVGLSSGQVQTYRLPSAPESGDDASLPSASASPEPYPRANGTTPILSTRRRSSTASESGLGSIDVAWKTKRHKGSCRALAYSHDGEIIYSAGTDGIVKAAATETGRVLSKIAIPNDAKGAVDAPTVLHALTPQTLILGTDSGKLYVYDLREQAREMSSKAAREFSPHGGDFVSSLTPLPAGAASTSGFPKSWVSTGGSTVAFTDLRKGVLQRSEDQEDELTGSILISGLKKGGTSVGEKLLVGGSGGVVTLWEKGVWDDQDDRIVVDGGGSAVECMEELPMGVGVRVGMNEKAVATGLEDGRIRFMRIGTNKVIQELDVKHDEVDGVVAIGFDVAGRMVSGGGQFVKVWHEAKGSPGGMRNGVGKHEVDSDDSDEEEDESSDEETSEKRKRKKRKRNKGKDKSGGRVINFTGLG